MARVRAVEGTRQTSLDAGWQLASAPAGSIEAPTALAGAGLDWCPASLPSTAASSLRAAGKWSIDDRRDFDATDWWWKGSVEVAAVGATVRRHLRIGGLATLADVWVDGLKVLSSTNMFVEHDVVLEGAVNGKAEIVLCCRSVGAALKARRPRPRWRTRLVESQQLRWVRTTLLGRIPTWAPTAAPVGPWRPIQLEQRTLLSVARVDVRPRIDGSTGLVTVEAELEGLAGDVENVRVRVGNGASNDLACSAGASARHFVARGTARVEQVERWWPHTHGSPRRYSLSLEATVGGRKVAIDLGKIGFRGKTRGRDRRRN